MKEIFTKYRPFLQFLGVFLVSYLVFIGIYQLYLSQYDAARFEVDGVSNFVAEQSEMVLEAFDYEVTLVPHPNEASVKVLINADAVVRIVEGCNAVSVMILFVAFVLAFSKGFYKTFAFIATGLLIIHILNILRIALLTIGILKYPAYTHILHGVIFPLIIYGVVFLLWIFWITKITDNVSKNS